MAELSLHGQTAQSQLESEGYESPEEYADQGDTRVIRDLLFGYSVSTQDAAGNEVISTREAYRDDEVTTEQIGLLALIKGEGNHSFYTSAELKRREEGGSGAAPVSATGDISELGAYELAEWLATSNPDTGRAWTINEVLEKVGDDTDLAHRMIEAENIRSDGDPRQGLVDGLNRVIGG